MNSVKISVKINFESGIVETLRGPLFFLQDFMTVNAIVDKLRNRTGEE